VTDFPAAPRTTCSGFFATLMEYAILAEFDCEEVELARYTGDYKFEVAGMYCSTFRTVVAD